MTAELRGPQTGRPLRAVLLGAGSLGKALLRRLAERAEAPVQLVAVATQHHGVLMDPGGIDPAYALNLVQGGGLGEGPELPELLRDAAPELLIECIPQNIRSGEPALGYLRQALAAGVHVVTSNKAPIVLGYPELLAAATQGAQLRFGAAILDGLPLFSLPRVGGDRVCAIRGVFNATSSIVLEAVQDGKSRSRGLARAQAQGVAEADTTLDLDGWDAAAKAAMLARVWMDAQLRIVDVRREGLDGLKDADLRAQAAEGLRCRLVAEVRKTPELQAWVRPEALSPDDPLYSLSEGRGGVVVQTDSGGVYTMLQGRHGVLDAADGILRDCAELAQTAGRG